ncbi:Uncharacterised protein [Mycobacteroides abscessus]|nr:Uncharacterised protein [Mycobacteroides abscessus]SLC88956.1 Uncharacterised protein [Mycobacteroides abscessus subsp. massiliense]
MRDGAVFQAHELGGLVVPMDGVEVARDPGVIDQILPGELNRLLWQLVSYVDRAEFTQCHQLNPPSSPSSSARPARVVYDSVTNSPLSLVMMFLMTMMSVPNDRRIESTYTSQ